MASLILSPAAALALGHTMWQMQPNLFTVHVLHPNSLQTPIPKSKKWSFQGQILIQITMQRRWEAISRPETSENTYYNNLNKPKPHKTAANLHYKQSALKTTHLDSEEFVVQKFRNFNGKTPLRHTKTEAEGIYKH